MIPDFDDNGYLPPGIHPATLEEVSQRFGAGSEEREAGIQSLQWLVPLCRRAGIVRLIVNGSFVTNSAEPRDVDCILVPGASFVADSEGAITLLAGLPYLSLQIVDTPEELEFYTGTLFGSDRRGRPKGLIEVVL